MFGVFLTFFIMFSVYIVVRARKSRRIVKDQITTKVPGMSKNSTSEIDKPISNKVICSNCRNKLEENAVYCAFCGQNQQTLTN